MEFLETLESKLNNDYLALKSAILDAPYVKIFPEICQKSAISEFDCPHNSDQNWRKNSIVVSFDWRLYSLENKKIEFSIAE